jgi:nucleoside-diphosphate-sugar epimerase
MINNFNKHKNNVFNFGLEEANLSKLELANKIKTYINDLIIQESEFDKDPDKRDYIVSNKKILSTGFNFKKSLDNGIQELISGLLDKETVISKNV